MIRPARRARPRPRASGGREPPSAGRPFVLINMAITADGKIANANRRIVSFGSPIDQTALLELRASADAVMAGARTVDSQSVNMGPGPRRFRRLRLRRGLAEYNLRIVVSRSGSLDPAAEIFRHRFSPIIVLTTREAGRQRIEGLRRAGAQPKVCGGTTIDFVRALRWLRSRWGIRRLLCEGGGELNDALFRADLVDEVHLTVCPKIFGGRSSATIADGIGASVLSAATQLKLTSARRRGEEMFLVYRVIHRR